LDSIINVLGPDLQEVSKTRDLILTLIEQFQSEESSLVLMESLRCREHLSLYAPDHIDFALYVRLLQESLESPAHSIRNASLDGLHGIMRRDTTNVLEVADNGLEEKLWLLLDRSPGRDIIKSIMRNWLHQTGISRTSEWIRRCNTVLMKITMKGSRSGPIAPQKLPSGTEIQDEEIAGFNVTSASQMDEPGGSSLQELMKWQTRTFAMELLAELLFMVERDAEQHAGSSAELELQSKVGDVIRMAFSASTTGVVGLRIKGLHIINQILRVGDFSSQISS
jgi:HEAT repeat-containing protein 5